MSPVTKAKAKEKLETLKIGVGYPDAWHDDSGLSVVRGDAFGNFERAELFEYRRSVEKLGRAIDRGEWAIAPQVLNAMNLPVRNALNFPAAILSPPFSIRTRPPPPTTAPSVRSSVTRSAIRSTTKGQSSTCAGGSSIGGRRRISRISKPRAPRSRLNSARTSRFPTPAVDGKLTLSENIADLAGLSAAYDAWSTSLNGLPARRKMGSRASSNSSSRTHRRGRQKARPLERSRLATDVTRRRTTRADRAHIDAWYTAFDVKEGEPLFLAPNARVRVLVVRAARLYGNLAVESGGRGKEGRMPSSSEMGFIVKKVK